MILLQVIADGASYGYEIAQSVKRTSGGDVLAQEGTLYPALHRLEKRKLLKATWAESPQGRKRKHYKLTAEGKKQLEALREEWEAYNQSVRKLMGLADAQFVFG